MDWFDVAQFHAGFSDRCQACTALRNKVPFQFSITLKDQINSTNHYLRDHLPEAFVGTPGTDSSTSPNFFSCALVIAAQQTAGRGQWGRTWRSEVGGLYLSLGFVPPRHIEPLSLLPLAISWGIAQELTKHHFPIRLKWPNDLLLDQRKLGGILVETRTSTASPAAIIAGVGLNWQNTPPPPGIALDAYQQNFDQSSPVPPLQRIQSLEELAAIATVGILNGYHEWFETGSSAQHNSDRYNAILINRGQWIAYNETMGKIAGITPMGTLRVEFPDHQRDFLPGEIQLGY